MSRNNRSWEGFCAAYKTEMCRYRGHCVDREFCYYAHSEDELRTKTCLSFYFNARCERNTCDFRHSTTLPVVPQHVKDEFLRQKEKSRKRSRSRSPVRRRSRSPVRRRSPSPAYETVTKDHYDKTVAHYESQLAALRGQIGALTAFVIGLTRNAARHPVQVQPQPDPNYINSLLQEFSQK